MSGTRPDTYPTHTAESLVAPAFHRRVICRVARSPALASQRHEPGGRSVSLPALPPAGDSRSRRAPQSRAAVREAGPWCSRWTRRGRRRDGPGCVRERSWREGEAIAVAPPGGASAPEAPAREPAARGSTRWGGPAPRRAEHEGEGALGVVGRARSDAGALTRTSCSRRLVPGSPPAGLRPCGTSSLRHGHG